LYSVGKKRFDGGRKFDALLPLLHSVKLFVYGLSSIDPTSISTLKISNRFILISSLYKSLNMVDECIIATVSALMFDAVELSMCDTPNKNQNTGLLAWLADLTENVIGTNSASKDNARSAHRIGLQNSLVNLFLKRKQSKLETVGDSKLYAMTPARTIDLLLDSMNDDDRNSCCDKFEQRFSAPFNIGTIVQVFLSKHAIPLHQNCNQTIYVELFKIVMELVVRVGRSLQRIETDITDEKAASLANHSCLSRLAESLLLQFENEATIHLEVTRAMVNIVASISLMSSHPSFVFEGWIVNPFSKMKRNGPTVHIDSALKFANKAHAVLKTNSKKDTDLDPVSCAIHSALDLYRYQLSCIQEQRFVSCMIDIKRLQALLESIVRVPFRGPTFGLAWKPCLIYTLSRLCGMFTLEGEGLKALQVAKWSLDASLGDETDACVWFESVALSLLASNSVVSVRAVENCARATDKTLDYEVQCCRLRLLIRDLTNNSSLISFQSQFRSLLNELHERCDKSYFHRLGLWTRTTIYLGLSECAERQGDLETSLDCLKKCFEFCRELTENSRQNQEKESRDDTLACPFWIKVALIQIPVCCLARQAECLVKTAALYSRLGDYRRSVEYSFSALVSPAIEASGCNSRTTFAELVLLTRNCPLQNSREATSRRLLLRFKSLASPLDWVLEVFRKDEDQPYLSSVAFDQGCGQNRELELIFDLYESKSLMFSRLNCKLRFSNTSCVSIERLVVDMKNGYSALPTWTDDLHLNTVATTKFIQYSLSPQVAGLFDTLSSFSGCGERPYFQLQYDSKLRDAANILSRDIRDRSDAHVTALSSLRGIAPYPNCSSLCRAWSYYLLGTESLKLVRKSGELFRMWNSEKDSKISSSHFVAARKYFSDALLLLGTSCDVLKRNVLRSLALVSGPGFSNNEDAVDCFRLVNCSVGGFIKAHMLGEKTIGSDEYKRLTTIFGALECSGNGDIDSKSVKGFIDLCRRVVPQEWRFVTAALCPTGEMLITSLEFSECGDPICVNACLGPDSFDEGGSSPQDDVYDIIVKPLNEVIRRSQIQLSEDNIGFNHNEASKIDQTRNWWNTRKHIDSDLEQHLNGIERVLLSSDSVRRALLGQSFDSEYVDDSSDMPCGNLASRFEAASFSHENILMSPEVSELKEAFESFHIAAPSVRKMRNAELIRSPLLEPKSNNVNAGLSDSPLLGLNKKPRNNCTFLVLDENLLVFPFEGLPCFGGKTICRLPSLAFALAKLAEESEDRVNVRTIKPEETSYILDPESNLAGTKERLMPFIDAISDKYMDRWRGVVGEVPSVDFMEQVLSSEDGLLLYFGHGGGQQFFGRSKIEALGRRTGSSISSVVLLGCGSGKLESVNRKNSKSTSKVPIHYEPEGIALSYLLAGSPCVVGNLWDVTDHDIDRYAMALVSSIFEDASGQKSIAKCVAESRAACKMRYIVGCAPVCYGFPVTTPE
jgi:Peptidase family C50